MEKYKQSRDKEIVGCELKLGEKLLIVAQLQTTLLRCDYITSLDRYCAHYDWLVKATLHPTRVNVPK